MRPSWPNRVAHLEHHWEMNQECVPCMSGIKC